MLDAILDVARNRAASLHGRSDQLRALAGALPPARSFQGALSAPGLQVVAEVKRRSPSAGDIAVGVDVVAQALAYEAGGAAAISVLTEPDYFGGSLDDLRDVRRAVAVPVLRKDFIVSTDQIWEARAAGADAVLLIVAVLTDTELRSLLSAADAAGVDALVEAHRDVEVLRARRAGCRILGVNNRDLTTFVTDLATAESLAAETSWASATVAESGVSSRSGAARMAAAGYDAILVGEAAMRAQDPAAFVGELVGLAS